MNHLRDELSTLIADFVFRDRRIADQHSLRLHWFLDRSTTRFAPNTGSTMHETSDANLHLFGGVEGQAYATGQLVVDEDKPVVPPGMTLEQMREMPYVETIRSMVACPIFNADKTVGVLCLDSTRATRFEDRDLFRVQVLSALFAYELFHLRRGSPTRSPLSVGLGRVLRSAREELRLSQEDLAARIGTSRTALSRWEAGDQAPSRGPVRRWLAALGLLAGGRPEIIEVVDATPQLLTLLQENPGRLRELTPEQFELFVAERLDRMGYEVQRTGSITLRDGGIDIIALPRSDTIASFLLAVQVKHHRGSRKTGREDIDRLLAWQNTAFRLGMLVTNTGFTQDALWTASRENARHFLRLRDFSDLTRWLYGAFNTGSEWREIPDSIELAPGVSVQVPRPLFSEAGVVWPLKRARPESVMIADASSTFRKDT